MSKPRLIIFSDMFGSTEGDWMNEYNAQLNPFFQVKAYDSRSLANICASDQNEVHQEFVNGGIEIAAQRLLKLEPKTQIILGVSVGGTIAWDFAISNKVTSLYLLSATRLRNQKKQPVTSINLYFGENELNGPKDAWFDEFNLTPVIIKNDSHECYKNSSVIRQVCKQIIRENSSD